MWNRSQLSIAFFALSIFACLAAGPIEPLRVGNWRGGSFTDDTTGRFSHCAASASYVNGTSLHVSIAKNGSWSIGIQNPLWRWQPGQTFSADVSFDTLGPFRLPGHVILPNFVEIFLPANAAAVEAFRGALQMHLAAFGGVYHFNLTSTAELIPALRSCVIASLQGPQRARPSAPPAVSAAPPPAPATQPETAARPSPEVQAARDRLITAAVNDYNQCIGAQMKQIVPYSNENAETLAQVIETNCSGQEQHFVEVTVAISGQSSAAIESSIHDALEN